MTQDWIAEYEHEDDENERELAQNSWEAPLRRTWDEIEEDEAGNLKRSNHEQQRTERLKLAQGVAEGTVEKGMMRYVFLVVDMSKASSCTDLRPTRKLVAINGASIFIRDFFDQNPLSLLGIITAHNKKADLLTDISGNPLHQIRLLEDESDQQTGGEFSLQNCLELARASLRQTPDYGCREVIFISSSLSTCDPSDVFDTIQEMKSDAIRCSVISLSAEVYAFKSMCQITQGTFSVALNEKNFTDLLSHHVRPPPIPPSVIRKRRWVHMGFPQQRSDQYPSLCLCHDIFTYKGFICPRCASKLCELPSTCQVCSLTLVSAPHLARSYHHLWPIQPFIDVTKQYSNEVPLHCYACRILINSSESLVLQCPRCQQTMCFECDLLIHQSIHICPGCTNSEASLTAT